MSINLSTLQRFTEEVVLEAGAIALRGRSDLYTVQQKDAVDLSTNRDIEIEQFIIDRIEQSFPDHSVYSEEIGEVRKASAYRWIIDPIDGTKEYARGLSNWSICMMLEEQNTMLVAGVGIPSTGEVFSASKGNGAYCNGQAITISKQTTLAQSMVVLHSPGTKVSEEERSRHWHMTALIDQHSYKTFVRLNDNMVLCDLARGGYEAYIHLLPSGTGWWDIAPGLLIAAEAGAIVTTTKGEIVTKDSYKDGVVVGNSSEVHQEVMELLK